jgi:hypothetical protein
MAGASKDIPSGVAADTGTVYAREAKMRCVALRCSTPWSSLDIGVGGGRDFIIVIVDCRRPRDAIVLPQSAVNMLEDAAMRRLRPIY